MAATGAATTGVLIGALAGIPIAGPIAAAVASVGVLLANIFSGCGQTCVEATRIANQAEPLLLQNLQSYLSAPVHYASLQKAALNNFDFTWAALVQACSAPQLQAAGQNCVADRQAGACKWKASPGGWSGGQYTPAGPAGSGSTCWNWFVGYRDPIANDPTVVPDPPGSGLLSSIGFDSSYTLGGVPVTDLILPAALIIAGLML